MPFECRKNMTWGPHVAAVQLYGGDEVPSPVRASLLQLGHVARVDAVAGKKWCDQPEGAQKAWADCNGQTFLMEKRREYIDGQKEPIESEAVVAVKRHPSQMFSEGDKLPERMIDRPLEIGTPGPARPESLEAAGEEVVQADEPAPPLNVESDDTERATAGSVVPEQKPQQSNKHRHQRGRRSRR